MKKGNEVTVILSMHNSIEYMPNVSNSNASMHGFILLAVKNGIASVKGSVMV